MLLAACGNAPDARSYRKIVADRTERLCRPLAETEAAELESGSRRPVLMVSRYSAFETKLNLRVESDESEVTFRTPLMQKQGFNASEPEQPLRYVLPVAPGKSKRETCYLVSLVGPPNAEAVVALGMSDRLK